MSPLTYLIVSVTVQEAVATPLSDAAFMTLFIISGVTKGRAQSCMHTSPFFLFEAETPLYTDNALVSPPSAKRTGLLISEGISGRNADLSLHTTIISSTAEAAKAARTNSKTVFFPSLIRGFATVPIRVPLPAATIIPLTKSLLSLMNVVLLIFIIISDIERFAI